VIKAEEEKEKEKEKEKEEEKEEEKEDTFQERSQIETVTVTPCNQDATALFLLLFCSTTHVVVAAVTLPLKLFSR
jgi:type IV secretory pathway component VirB8